MSGPTLVLGPLLRHVGAHDATIWVETDAPRTVEVRCAGLTATSQTFAVAGHFYAIVVVDGLDAGAIVPYAVRLDGIEVVAPTRLRLPAKPDSHVPAGRASAIALRLLPLARDRQGEGSHRLRPGCARSLRSPDGWPRSG